MSDEYTNAVAGPSNSRPSTPSPSHPPLFLPPPGPPIPPAHLSSTQDLLARFQLLSAYDKYVRPFAAPTETGLDQLPSTSIPSGTSTSVIDKGKGREGVGTISTHPQTPGVGDDGDDEDGVGGKGEKKKKNTYKHLIKGVPGKHSMKKDDYLSTMMLVPPKQRMHISPFDLKTQREAFTVSLEGLKGWNPSALVLESAQAREDRKKRKEIKRLAKVQQHALSTSTPISNIHAPIATSVSASAPSSRPPGTVTAAPRPGSTVPRPTSAIPRPSSATSGSVVPRPTSSIPRPTSAIPRPAPVTAHPNNGIGGDTPMRTATPTGVHPLSAGGDGAQERRGKKRDRDDVAVSGVSGVNGTGATNGAVGNGNLSVGLNASNAPKPILNARAGIKGARPRPFKKQRMDVQGQARDVTAAPVQQQPTPQGV